MKEKKSTENRFFSLPKLPYGYNDLEPYISGEQLMIHHQKHHATYVKGLMLRELTLLSKS